MIFSPHEAVTIPETSLAEYVLGRAHEFGNKPALIDGLSGRTISYDELVDKTRRLATGLARHGFQRGDVLAIFSPNSPEYVLAFLAVAMLGGATAMVPPLFTDEEVRTQLADSQADYLMTIPQLLPKLKQVMPESTVRRVFVVGEAEGAVPFSALLDQKTQLPELNVNPRSDVVALPYSSGTTGFPKRCDADPLQHGLHAAPASAVEALTEADTLVCVVPMYHLYGLHVVVNLGLSQGATIVTLPRYDLGQFLKTLERYEVTVAPLVPPLVLDLSRAPELDHHDLSKLRLIHCGAAPLAADVAQACSERLGCPIRFGYGLTEVSPLSHSSLPSIPDKPESVGYCLPNTECKIVDYTTGEELGPNQAGEIWVRGPQVMKGYLGNNHATAEMLRKDGWLRTGDIGYAEEDGRLFVIDRVKELIKYKGRQVAPPSSRRYCFHTRRLRMLGLFPVRMKRREKCRRPSWCLKPKPLLTRLSSLFRRGLLLTNESGALNLSLRFPRAPRVRY